jgi:hypothetical protein
MLLDFLYPHMSGVGGKKEEREMETETEGNKDSPNGLIRALIIRALFT